jgi:hypothetical protein
MFILGDESESESDNEDESRAKGDFPLLLFACKNNRTNIIKGYLKPKLVIWTSNFGYFIIPKEESIYYQ